MGIKDHTLHNRCTVFQQTPKGLEVSTQMQWQVAKKVIHTTWQTPPSQVTQRSI